jgi:MIP family channel proteins
VADPAAPGPGRPEPEPAPAVAARARDLSALRRPRPAPEGPVEERGLPAYAAEFLGTFVLVFFICMIFSVSAGLGFTDFAVIGLVHAFVLLLLIHSLGGTSGAHFNPAVTVALTAVRKIAPPDALIYVFLQLAGAVAGALVCRLLLEDPGRAVDYGATVVSEQLLDGSVLKALVAEFIGAFVLMWAYMAMTVNPRGSREWAGLVIGATLGVAVMVIAPLTGAGFNPARSFGPAIVGGEGADFWLYVLGPLLGALAAAFAYLAIVLGPESRLAERPVDKLS